MGVHPAQRRHWVFRSRAKAPQPSAAQASTRSRASRCTPGGRCRGAKPLRSERHPAGPARGGSRPESAPRQRRPGNRAGLPCPPRSRPATGRCGRVRRHREIDVARGGALGPRDRAKHAYVRDAVAIGARQDPRAQLAAEVFKRHRGAQGAPALTLLTAGCVRRDPSAPPPVGCLTASCRYEPGTPPRGGSVNTENSRRHSCGRGPRALDRLFRHAQPPEVYALGHCPAPGMGRG